MYKIVKLPPKDKLKSIQDKEFKLIRKLKSKKKQNYIKKNKLKKKIGNSQIFTNIKNIDDNGLITLKTGQLAIFYRLQPIDLSLTNKSEQELFYHTLARVYRLPITIKAYKFDEKINLNANKENYQKLIEKYRNNKSRYDILSNNKEFIDVIEQENITSASSYYFSLIAKNKEELEKYKEEFERLCLSTTPKLEIANITNKKHLLKIFCNMYFSNVNLDQLIYYDLFDLIVPMNLRETPSQLKFDDKVVQMVTIKNYPLFLEGGFLDRIVNIPNINVSMTINESIDSSKILNILNANFKSVLADYNTSKNLSDVTEMQSLMNNYKLLIEQISANDEKIKEVSIVMAVTGSKKQREETIKEIKRNAEIYQIKVDVPKLRQMELWQSYDLSNRNVKDYPMFVPTLTFASSFPFSEIYHNDSNGWLIGEDAGYGLPAFFDPFYLNNERTSHNISIVGSTGCGKSYLMKLLVCNEFARGTKIFLFDIENEYQKFVERNNGEYIDLSSKSLINPLQVRFVQTNDEDDENTHNILSKHLGFLETFFTTVFQNITEKELVVLLDIVEKFYKTFGITKNTTLEQFERFNSRDYPIFSELYDYLIEYKKKVTNKEESRILVNIEVLLKRLIIGQDANLFNGYTTIDLSNDLIAFNLQELMFNSSRRLINTQMINLLTFLNNEIVSNKKNNDTKDDKKRGLIVVDEFHSFIDEENPTLLKYFASLTRKLRKYSYGMVLGTQSIQDLVGTAQILRNATAIFNNCQYQFTGMLKDDDLQALEKIYANNKLTETQKAFLTRCNQGQFLINITNKQRLRINVYATPLETYYMGESEDKFNYKENYEKDSTD
ncbi:MAG: DUF87 domain-containing protein [Bacilli bacterium]|nr:DUF87 domain-containing protein [Bacilli bacterium]